MSTPNVSSAPECRRRVGLTFKFFLAFVLLVVMVMSVVTGVVYTRVREALLVQMRNRGMAVARALADNVAEALVTADHLLLAELVDKVVKQEKGINHVALVDENNIVLTHSDFNQETKPYLIPEAAIVEAIDQTRISQYSIEGRSCMDFEVPILLEDRGPDAARELGRVHVVYFLEAIERTLYALLVMILLVTAGGLALGIIFAHFLANLITRSISQLAELRSRNEEDK